jgi:hypothetical protein
MVLVYIIENHSNLVIQTLYNNNLIFADILFNLIKIDK